MSHAPTGGLGAVNFSGPNTEQLVKRMTVRTTSRPEELEVSAWSEYGIIMGVRHKTDPVEGIQFHPESIMTKAGKDILANFLAL